MIPLYKLEKLPRNQKLRKTAKIFAMAETRLYGVFAGKSSNFFNSQEIAFFADTAKILAEDKLFSADAKKTFFESMEVFQTAVTAPIGDLSMFLRALNNVKHLLFMETGKDQSDWDFTDNDGKLDPEKRQIFKGMWVYMEDIRSPFNVGAMFRTAESFGVEKIILSPLCADPRHRRAERTAMGCVDVIPWERQDLFSELENAPPPCPIFALETGGIPLAEFHFPRFGIMITGSEELGVSPRGLAAADASLGRVTIPCYGAKASLNVSVAFGIAVQAWGQYNSSNKNSPLTKPKLINNLPL
jgi:TrmH family RNA methyltransferase